MLRVHLHLTTTMCFYRLQTKLWKGNVFTSVCQEFCPPPPRQQTATAADGPHPTGMHSCLSLHFVAMCEQ